MATFSDAVAKEKSEEISRTENNMKAFKTTDSFVLDLFSKVASSRFTDFTGLFCAAHAEDSDLAVRCLLWLRDIREGAGERKNFRDLLLALEQVDSATAGRLIPKIPELGRWDDLFVFQKEKNRDAALHFYANAISEGNSLAAKWAPREVSSKKANTASKKIRNQNAKNLRKKMGLSPRQYRKTLANATQVVENQMCANEWGSINFSHVPSVASARYQRAFHKNAPLKYEEYVRELQKPENERDPKVKINASAIFPHDVVNSIFNGEKDVANEQWNAMPDYIGDAKLLPMVDVSGSMGVPIAGRVSALTIAIGLGLYMSSKNSSDFKDMFLTFSGSPELLKLKGELSSKISQMKNSKWGFNTNFHLAFDKMLEVAKKGDVKHDDMPEHIVVLSDMQFDNCAIYDDNAIEMIRRKYFEAGYKMPKIIFWNLNGMFDNTPVKVNEKGVVTVSGFSPTLMKTVLKADPENFEPYQMMLQVLKNPRYDY